MSRSSWRLDPVLTLAIVAQAAFGAVFIASTRFDVNGQTYFTLFDDAMVSMTYARNFAAGHGLVWNAGGPPVEGYTNFLWTLWMAALHFIGISESTISLAVAVSGLLILIANLVVVWKLARMVSSSLTTARIAVLATCLCYPLIFWTLRGMEVGLMALVVNLALLQVLKAPASGGFRMGLAAPLLLLPLIRPDGIVPAMIVAAFAGWTWMRAGRTREAIGIALCPVAVLLAHTGMRWWYYGDVLPNTYYLKVAGIPLFDRLSRGVTTLWETVQTNLWLTFTLGLLIRVDERLRLIAGVVVIQASYSIWVGGDAWEQSHYANRYLAVVLPLALLLAASGVEALFSAPRSIARAIVAGVVSQILIISAVIDGLAVPALAPGTWLTFMTFAGIVVKGAAGVWFLVAAASVATSRPVFSRSVSRVLPVSVALLMTLSGTFVGEWLDGEALHIKDDARAARLGLDLKSHTSPEASIAVVWAGAIPYFSQRRAIDFLGKSDVHVAHEMPRRPFVPGHDKWNYEYSVGELKPDVIAQTWRWTPVDVKLLQMLGYEQIGRESFVRRASDKVDAKQLTELFAEFDRTAPANPRPQR